jgi:hypothetical protein
LRVLAVTLLPLYLLVGALDWSVAQTLLAHALSVVLSSFSSSASSSSPAAVSAAAEHVVAAVR